MKAYTALLDANILYPAPIRDIFLQLAVMDQFQAKWTAEIHEEWINALMRNEPQRDRARLERTRDLMNHATRDCLITGYEHLISALQLPDENDRHVLAAAIVGHCDVIVTQNLQDFPEATLAPYGIEVQHPDEFLCSQLDVNPGLFCQAMRIVRRRLKSPAYSTQQHLDVLTQQGLIATVAELKPFQALLTLESDAP